MGHLLRSFFMGTGGLGRYLFFQILNLFFDKNYSKDVDYYLYDNNSISNNGFSTPQKNFISGILIFVLLLLLIEKIEG